MKKIVALVLVVLLVLGLTGCELIPSFLQEKPKSAVSDAYIDEDGNAYIALMDGSCVMIGGEVASASSTADCEHIAVVMEDGEVYFTDMALSEKTDVANNGDSILNVFDDGFFYSDEDGRSCRMLFADGAPTVLEGAVDTAYAKNKASVLYSTEDGGIYSLGFDSYEAERVGSSDDAVMPTAVSDDGQICVWTENDGETERIVCSDGGMKETLGEFSAQYGYADVEFSRDQKMLAVYSSGCDCMWVKTPGEDTKEFKLGACADTSGVYSAGGRLKTVDAADVDMLIMAVEADEGMNVYSISIKDGERERIASGVKRYQVEDGVMVYIDADGELYYMKLDGRAESDRIKVASEVDVFKLPTDSKYIYYMKYCKDQSGSLYCCRIGDDSPYRITEDAACWCLSFAYSDPLVLPCLDYSVDGATVYYISEITGIEDGHGKYGTLMAWSYGDEDSTLIATEVINYSITSMIENSRIDNSSLFYEKYVCVDADGNVIVNLMHYDGKTAERMASNLYY